ncbi:22292_t:CDS:2, partial [Racocetra persica]
PPHNDDDLKHFEDNLREKMNIFHNEVTTNEATAKEFILVEVELDRSHGYGVLDYGIYIQKIPVLVTEAKLYKSEKAIAQTLVQIHSRFWRFIRWNGSLECPKAKITQEYPCIFKNDMKEAKRVVSYIVYVLQAQAKSLNKEKPFTINNQNASSTKDKKSIITDSTQLQKGESKYLFESPTEPVISITSLQQDIVDDDLASTLEFIEMIHKEMWLMK